MRQKVTKQLAAILLSLVMVLGMITLLPAQTYAKSSQGDDIITFTSDVHNEGNNEGANRLGNWIDAVNKYVSEDDNATSGIDLMTFCGDLGVSNGENQTDGNGNISDTTYWSYVTKVIEKADEKLPGKVVFTTGNHELEDGHYDYSKYGSYIGGDIQSRFVIDKLVADEDNYEVYVMGTAGTYQSSDGYLPSQITHLQEYFDTISANSSKTYFIASHYPLHTISNRSTKNAGSVVDTINNAITEKNLKVVFIWGHNHSQRDDMYSKVLVPGQTNNNSFTVDSATKTVKFYYIPAGCMSDSENKTGGPDQSIGASWIKSKGVMFRIPADNSTISYGTFDKNGDLINSQETLLDSSEWDHSIKVESVEISDTSLSLEVEESKQLTATVKPEDATNPDVTWSVNNDAIATVSDDGTVTGVAKGVTTVTVTSKSNKKASASCTVTVKAKSVTPDPSGGGNQGDQSKDKDKSTDNVNATKQTALNQLNNAISQTSLASYGTDQQLTIINLAMDYKKKINAATSSDEVNKLLAEFQAAVNKLPKANSGNTNNNAAATAKATKITLKSLTAGKNKLTVKWTANAKVFDGYEVSYRIKGKKWKAVKVSGAKKSSKVIKKLKKGKTYQVKVRGYKMSGSTAVYGKYSKTKSKKVK